MIDELYRACQTIRFVRKTLSEGFGNPYKLIHIDPQKRAIVMANGPSLKIFLSELKSKIESYDDCDFFAVNDFIHDELCSVIKPKYYILSDPMFFRETKLKERGMRTMQALHDKVTWNMYLYVSYRDSKSKCVKKLLENQNIRLITFHSYKYEGIDRCRNYFFNKGWGNGNYSTVVSNGIFLAISLGYKNIELYGVDHTLFSGLCVNDRNIPCYEYSHAYENTKEIKPMVYPYDFSREYKDMPYFLNETYTIFNGHHILAKFAEYKGVEILNCTKGSMIDAYKRK